MTVAERSLNPLWQEPVDPPLSPRELVCERCPVAVARELNEAWHSRLPRTQVGPWQFAFAAHKTGIVYAVALWHNPSARGLPSHWLELRRLAVAPDAPGIRHRGCSEGCAATSSGITGTGSG